MPRHQILGPAGAPRPVLRIVLLVALSARAALADPRAPAAVTPPVPAAKTKASPAPRLASAAADEKQRVPKPPRESPRFKPDSASTGSGSGSGDESDDWTSQCIGDCLVNLVSSICSGLTSPSGSSAASTSHAGGAAWAVGDRARLAANLADSVALFGSPGDEMPAPVRLAHGERVVVLETAVLTDGVWIRVRPEDRLEPVGWVRDASALRVGAVTKPAQGSRPRHAGGGIRIEAGGSGFGPAELNVEYRNGGYRAAVEVLRFRPRRWEWGAGVGYRQANGSPQVIYLTPATSEEPTDSRLWMLDLGVRSGQRFQWGSGFRFDWLLGPVLTYVHESCDLQVTDAATGALIVRRKETLGRWAAGGVLRLGFGRVLSSGSELTLVSSGHVLAWEGHDARSLSSDFVHRSLHGFDVALGLTFPTR